METAKERLVNKLIASGLSEEQAEAIFEEARKLIESRVPDYRIKWNLSADGYPEMTYALWWIDIKRAALEWIDKNVPNAWFRGLFDPNDTKDND
jgi:hypothetical protein